MIQQLNNESLLIKYSATERTRLWVWH